MLLALAAPLPALAQADPATMRVVGNFSANRAHVDGIERPFFAQLAQIAGIRTNVTFNPMAQVGIEALEQIVLPIWRDACLRVDQTCPATWNQTVGSVAGLTIR